MITHASHKGSQTDAAERGVPADWLWRSMTAYIRPAIILVAGLALSAYCFRTMQEWERRYLRASAAATVADSATPYVVLIGGCALTLFSALCWAPQNRRSVGHRCMPGQQGIGQVELEQALRASEETLSRILDGTPIPLFVVDRRHVITHWNQACQNLTGIPAREVVGTRKAWAAFYPDERPVMADLVVDQRPEEEIVAMYGDRCCESPMLPAAYECEAAFAHLGIGGRWLLFMAAPVRDATGSLVGAIETFQDITDRKRVEGELQRRIEDLSEAQRRMEVLVSNTTDREKRMVALKREVNDLRRLLGREPKYQGPQLVDELIARSSASVGE